MSITLAVLIWTLVGGATSLWLAFVRYDCSNRRAFCICAACGPSVWLFILAVFVWAATGKLERGL